jgi:predicted DNA binding CopG/RHH family protein
MKHTLDKYEQQVENSLSKGDFVSTSDLEDTKQLFQEAAKNYLQLQETRSITLRVKKEDLIKVKATARRNGIAYQTLINLLIRQYINKETEVVL